METAVVVLLGTVLAACSLVLLVRGSPGPFRAGIPELVTACAAGFVAAAVIRVNVRVHRRWKLTLGRFTAAAALCAVSAVAGALVVLVPGECPGDKFAAGRCGVRESSTWGMAAGLGAVVNFSLAGFALGLYRSVRDVLLDGSAQAVDGLRALKRIRRERAGRSRGKRPRGGA
ncbi:hypothetical protein [Actinomadura sp. B10D3]|uniref:hypothetical protein n=1 Tax=Actinomadura sp. B10D3 TaxID=3153557 RepID=UPI00325C772A